MACEIPCGRCIYGKYDYKSKKYVCDKESDRSAPYIYKDGPNDDFPGN